MATTHFHRILKAKVEEEIRKLETGLARGSATDHNKYSLIVGQVMGLEACLHICDGIEREFDEHSDPA